MKPRALAAKDRLRRALLAFQDAQLAFLTAHRHSRSLVPAEAERFWGTQGSAIEGALRTAASEVLAAFQAFSAAGLVADAPDRHMVNEARRRLAEG